MLSIKVLLSHLDIVSKVSQVSSSNQTIPSIVAGTGQNQHTPAAAAAAAAATSTHQLPLV
jgi:hypothetical protein